MATAYAPMASQLMKSSLVCSKPRGLSGASLTRRPRFTVKAIQSEKPTYQVVQPINGDPFIGSLETPVTSSPLVAWYLSNLPAYRTAVSPLLRGIEVGLAHGYLLVGPFALTGPLRNTPVHGQAGALGAAGLVAILSVCLTMYGVASFGEGEPSTAPTLTLTGRKKEADKLQTADGWAKFTGGFFFGGISGVLWAYFLLYVLDLPYFFKRRLFSSLDQISYASRGGGSSGGGLDGLINGEQKLISEEDLNGEQKLISEEDLNGLDGEQKLISEEDLNGEQKLISEEDLNGSA